MIWFSFSPSLCSHVLSLHLGHSAKHPCFWKISVLKVFPDSSGLLCPFGLKEKNIFKPFPKFQLGFLFHTKMVAENNVGPFFFNILMFLFLSFYIFLQNKFGLESCVASMDWPKMLNILKYSEGKWYDTIYFNVALGKLVWTQKLDT